MKFFFIISTILLFSLSTAAQLDKGTWLMGGTGKVYSTKGTYSSSSVNNTSTNLNVELSPSLGFFLIDKLAAGLRPSFSWNKEVPDNGGAITSEKRLSIGPFARYYFLNAEKQYNLLADISYQYGVYRFYGRNGTINTFSIMAGPEVFFTESVGLEVLIGYTSRTEDVTNAYRDTKKGLQISIGFQIHLFNDDSYW